MAGTQGNDVVIIDDEVIIDLRCDRGEREIWRPHLRRSDHEFRDPEVDRLLDAAWAVLARSGWDCLKVERVLVEAGLSTRSFYRHFANKNELLVVMLQHDIEFLAAMLDDAVGALESPIDQLTAWMVGLASVGTGPKGASHARFFLSRWWELSHEFPTTLAHCEDTMVAPLIGILEAGMAKGVFKVGDPWQDARIIQVIAMDQLASSVAPAGSVTKPEQIESMVRFVHRSLGVPETAYTPA